MRRKCENCRYRDDPAGSDPCCSCFEASKWEARTIYENLANRLRKAAGPAIDFPDTLYDEAADAIDALFSELRLCRNELCLKCGDYKFAHKGACDGCRWKDMGD